MTEMSEGREIFKCLKGSACKIFTKVKFRFQRRI